MKLNAALAKSLLMAASIGMVMPVLAQTTTQKPAEKAKAPAKTAPAKPATAPVAEEKNPEEIVLPGIVRERPKGGFMSVQVINSRLTLSFYDEKKKEMPVDVARAAARWRSNKKVREDHTVLNPSGDGKTLIGAGVVTPPYTFKLFLTLLGEEGTAVESYVVDMYPQQAALSADNSEKEAE